MIPSQEERGMFINKQIINRDYLDTKINVKESVTNCEYCE